MDYELNDGDDVEVIAIKTIGELLEDQNIELYYQVSPTSSMARRVPFLNHLRSWLRANPSANTPS